LLRCAADQTGYICDVQLAEAIREPLARSFFYEKIRAFAAPRQPHAWLIDEANRRGFHGAFNSDREERPADARLSLEDIVVGLLSPHAEKDARTLKLVLRILQSGQLNLTLLLFRARRERSAKALWWLLQKTPESERNTAVSSLLQQFGEAPRGYRDLNFVFDPARLIKRPATRGALRRPTQR
jgi:hypothetical protein